MKKVIIKLLCSLLVLSCIGCSKKETAEESSSNAEVTETDVEGLLPDFIGTFYNENESYITINKDTTVEISITGLAVFEGKITAIEGTIATMLCTDPNGADILFTYDRSTRTFTIAQTSWDYLVEGDSMVFDLDKMPIGENSISTEDLELYLGSHSSEDGSYLLFHDNGDVDVVLNGIDIIDASIDYTAGEICELSGIDDDNNTYSFEYDNSIESLTVIHSTNENLPVDTTYIFDVEPETESAEQ